MSWSFGDDTGWMIGEGFFLAFSLAIGWAAYGVSSRFLAIGSLDQSVPRSRRGSVLLDRIIGGGVFVMLAMTSLSGFAQLMFKTAL